MPTHASRAILRDILELGLDPAIKHTQIQKNGRLAPPDQLEIAVAIVESVTVAHVEAVELAPVEVPVVEEKLEPQVETKAETVELVESVPPVEKKPEPKLEVKKEEQLKSALVQVESKKTVTKQAEPEKKPVAKKPEKPVETKPIS